MRLRAIAFALGSFAAAGTGAWWLAATAVAQLEARTTKDIEAALAAGGQPWAEVRADGLVITLAGLAPDETSRLRAIEIAHQALEAGRIEDAVEVARARPLAPPAFALELLRNDDEVSLIGLVPAGSGRGEVAAALAAAGFGGSVTDMLETADHPAPRSWAAALGYALEIAAALPRAKVEVAPGSVTVTAVAEDEDARAALARRLEAGAPEGVALDLALSAPRPVIAPFTVAFRRLPDGEGRLVVCSAETEADAARILAAARAAGLTAEAGCRLGLGAPSRDWAEAAALGIAAVAEMGGGAFAITDLEAVLTGPPALEPARLAAIGAELGEALPPVFTLSTRGAAAAGGPAGEDGAPYAPTFQATLDGTGEVEMAGPVADRTSEIALIGFAEAIFGHGKVSGSIVLDPELPEGWPGRVLAAIEALSLLEAGRVEVTPEAVAVAGRSLQEAAGAEIEAFFAAKGDERVLVDVTFDAEAAERLAEADRPPAEVCAEAVAAILAEEMILFEVGSAAIDPESADVLAAIAEVLASCPGARFEVGGHTDSQGRAEFNQELSEARAEAVVAALRAEGVLLVDLEPRGFGPDRPIADNDTEEGRALNRRIEFALLAEAEAETPPGAGEGADGAAGEEEDAAGGADGEAAAGEAAAGEAAAGGDDEPD